MNKSPVKRRHAGGSICSAVIGCFLIVACRRDGAPTPIEPSRDGRQSTDSESAQIAQKGAPVPSKADAVRIATEWLGALRARERARLQKLAAVPFELEELVEHSKCEAKRAEKPDDVPAALECLLLDDLLMEELAAQPAPVTEVVGASELPPWAAKLKGGSYPGELVQVRLPGDGVSYQFLILATSAGVRRVWKFVEYDPN